MKKCQYCQKNLVAHICGELSVEKSGILSAHLETCPRCQREKEELEEVIKNADSLQPDFDEVAASVDWKEISGQISRSVFNKFPVPPRQTWLGKLRRIFSQPHLRPAYAGVLIGLLLGSLATFLVLRSPQVRRPADKEFFASRDFLDSMEVEMTRKETIDYLEKSQYLLLDFVQSQPDRAAAFWQSDYASRTARDLLSKKKYINQQLDRFQMAKARAICDQIEILFFELMDISSQMSPEEVRQLQNLIEGKKLLLKINLLKKELRQDEV